MIGGVPGRDAALERRDKENPDQPKTNDKTSDEKVVTEQQARRPSTWPHPSLALART